jgi:hypothetical protein
MGSPQYQLLDLDASRDAIALTLRCHQCRSRDVDVMVYQLGVDAVAGHGVTKILDAQKRSQIDLGRVPRTNFPAARPELSYLMGIKQLQDRA